MHPDMKAVKQIDRADKMADGFLNLNQPNIRVIAQPEPSNKHITSITDIKEFAEDELKGLCLSNIPGGICAVTSAQDEYWNLSECGVFYHSRIWDKTRKEGYEYLSFTRLIKYIVKWITKAGYFYRQSEYSGDIAITVCVYEVLDEPLAGLEDVNYLRAIESVEEQKFQAQEVFADARCLAKNLVDREHAIDTVEKLVIDGLLQRSNIFIHSGDRRAWRKLIEEIVDSILARRSKRT